MADGATEVVAAAPDVVASVSGAGAGVDGVGTVVVAVGLEAKIGRVVAVGVGTRRPCLAPMMRVVAALAPGEAWLDGAPPG